MKQVGVFEAKTNLSRLIEQVEKGETVTITRHGKPVAKLVSAHTQPAGKDHPLSPEKIEKRRRALEELRGIANELKINPTQEEIKIWIREGRH